jgi:hypothetical protein
MMQLVDLEAEFVCLERTATTESHVVVETMARADGVRFLCPKCFTVNGGAVGTHMILCWSRACGVPDEIAPKPGRWQLSGHGLHDLTLNAEPGGSHLVSLAGGCGWHGYVTNGCVADA